jgi:PAS domain S-box-containing protein
MNGSELAALDLPTAVEDLAAPAYVINREGRFSWVNRAMVECLGDLRGELFIEYVAPEHRQLARTNFTRKVVGKTTRIFEMVVLDRNGGRIPMRFTSAPLRRDGHIVGIFGVGMPLAQASSFKHSPLEDLTPRQQESWPCSAKGSRRRRSHAGWASRRRPPGTTSARCSGRWAPTRGSRRC